MDKEDVKGKTTSLWWGFLRGLSSQFVHSGIRMAASIPNQVTPWNRSAVIAGRLRVSSMGNTIMDVETSFGRISWGYESPLKRLTSTVSRIMMIKYLLVKCHP
jgi:hypothetical protein